MVVRGVLQLPPVRIALIAMTVLALVMTTGGRAGAQSAADQPDPETGGGQDPSSDPNSDPNAALADRIQILGVTEGDGEVTLDVAVPPAIGRLAPVDANFAVTDGGQLVDVSVSPIGAAADTVIALDTSGSMRGSALAAAKTAAGSFIRTLPDDARIGLISFGDTVTTHRIPTLDRAGLLADIDGLTATGTETVLWDSLLVAAAMVGGPEAGPSSVVVLSDGDDTNSTADPSDVVAAFSVDSTVLYAVAIESPDTDLVALEATVDQVGGQFLATTDIGQLDSLYTDIAGRLANRYRLGFVPAVEGTRTVVVSVAADGGAATASIIIDGVAAVPDTPTGTPTGAPAPVLNIDDQPVLGAVAAPVPSRFGGPTMLWVGLASLFGALAVALIGLIAARPPAVVLLDAASGADRLGGINARMGQAIDRLIVDHDQGRRFDARLEAADINLRPGEFVLAWSLATSMAAVIVSALAGLVVGGLVVPFSAVVALTFLGIRTNRRRRRFGDQLTETMGIMASSLRSGQSLPRAIELVATEAPSPTAEEFHRISFEIRVGRDLTDSIRDTARRMASPDLEWLAQAVDINRELGGDLTEILDNVAATIRERRTVARQIDALSAEGRATGWVLLGMPIVLFLFSWWRTPNSIEALVTEPVGRILLVIAVTGMTVGHLWVRRLVKLKY